MTAVRWKAQWRAGARDIVLASLFYSGVLWVLALARMRRRVTVLTYHRVLPLERWADSYSSPGIIVCPRTFDWQMRFLRKYLRPISVREFVALLDSGAPIPSRSCLVTFDDGWYDTYRYALPILRRHAIPAALFVPTDYIGTDRCFWQEHLARLLLTVRHFPETRRVIGALLQMPEPDQQVFASRESIRNFVTELKSHPVARVEALRIELKRLSGDAPGVTEDRFLTWEEVAELAAGDLVTIGSHATSHRPLTSLPVDEVRRELLESLRILQERLHQETTTLAYPNGDATPATAAVAGEVGFRAAFTTRRGHVRPGADRLLLSRINIHESATRTRARFFGRILDLP